MRSQKIKNLGKIRFLVTITFLSFSFLIQGCQREANWINVDPKSLAICNLNKTVQIKALVFDKMDRPLPEAKIRWESSNPKVATVDQNGVITPKASGNATISALANGAKAIVQVKISIPAIVKIIPEGPLTLKVGETIEFKAEVLDESGRLFEDQTIGWGSSNHSVVNINAFEGVAKALAPGETIIKASLGTTGTTNEIKVIVK